MWRLIFFGLIIWLVLTMLKRNPSKLDTERNNDTKSKSSDVEDMVQCEHCAIHLPRSEAFLVNGKIYCSKNHNQNS